MVDFGKRSQPLAHATDHQDAGDDEISVAALSGELADDQEAKAHAFAGVRHVAGTLAALNLKVSDATLDKDTDTRTPDAHKASHQDGGTDEISVAALSGELADNQPVKAHDLAGADHNADTLADLNLKVSDATLDDSADPRTPAAHKASHEDGGADEIVVTGLVGSGGFVDRGDPAAWDATQATLTLDLTWNNLDLSSVIPAGATAACIVVTLQDDAVGSVFSLRANGVTNAYCYVPMWTQVVDQDIGHQAIIALDGNRIIQYYATNTTWTTINLLVTGWFT